MNGGYSNDGHIQHHREHTTDYNYRHQHESSHKKRRTARPSKASTVDVEKFVSKKGKMFGWDDENEGVD